MKKNILLITMLVLMNFNLQAKEKFTNQTMANVFELKKNTKYIYFPFSWNLEVYEIREVYEDKRYETISYDTKPWGFCQVNLYDFEDYIYGWDNELY